MILTIETQAPEGVVVTFGDRQARAEGKGATLKLVRSVVKKDLKKITAVRVVNNGGSWSHLRSAVAIAQTLAFVRGLKRPLVPAYSGKPKVML